MYKSNLQIEVCKALISGRRVSGGFINDNEFAVTVDGYRAYIFGKSEIIFDINKITPFDCSKIFADTENDIPVKYTETLREKHGKTLCEYAAEATSLVVYLDKTLIKPFEDCTFFANAPTNRVLCKDKFNRTIGVILPVKMN